MTIAPCNGNTRLVESQGSTVTETYPSTRFRDRDPYLYYPPPRLLPILREIGTLIGKVDKVEAQLTKLKSTVEQQNKLIGEFIRSSLVLRNAKHPILLHQLILSQALGITSTEEEMHKDMLRRQIIADTKSQAMAAASD